MAITPRLLGVPDTELRASMVRAVYSLSGRPSAEERTGSFTAATKDVWHANNRLTFSHNSLEVESEENGVPDFQLSQKHESRTCFCCLLRPLQKWTQRETETLSQKHCLNYPTNKAAQQKIKFYICG